MNITLCKKYLRATAQCSLKKYPGDAADTMFKVFVLGLLEDIVIGLNKVAKSKTKKREPSAYNLHVAMEIANGKSFKEAIKSYKKTS